MNTVPRCWLLDARERGWSDDELRSHARAWKPDGAPHVSRSYRFPFALVAGHHTSVGVDLERVERLDERFARAICTHEELGHLARLLEEPDGLSSLWSSKEAVSKALGDPLAYDPRLLAGPALWGSRGSAGWHAASVEVPDGHVGWLVWRQRSEATHPGAVVPRSWSPRDQGPESVRAIVKSGKAVRHRTAVGEPRGMEGQRMVRLKSR
ncbi:MAG TPA: 4'-phosphopantetheinyl transferase superfamily protein [Marmoricola sp.]|nr:4'-phosphopantetheinyl transferase superfamily protein [Marmoricola sp.]